MSFRFALEVEAADEAFWQKQEARKRGLLGQPCCTQSNMSWAMMDVPGDFAVVVHGEFDRANRVDGRATGGVQSVDLDCVAR